jgi:hypothetical protein
MRIIAREPFGLALVIVGGDNEPAPIWPRRSRHDPEHLIANEAETMG